MSDRRCARIPISYRYLEEALKLPPGAKIVHTDNSWTIAGYHFNVFVEYPEFPEIEEGMPAPEATAVYYEGEECSRLEARE